MFGFQHIRPMVDYRKEGTRQHISIEMYGWSRLAFLVIRYYDAGSLVRVSRRVATARTQRPAGYGPQTINSLGRKVQHDLKVDARDLWGRAYDADLDGKDGEVIETWEQR